MFEEMNMNEDNCTNCKGTGEQVFHRAFESVVGNCNFCEGTGKREIQLGWLDRAKKALANESTKA